VSARDQVHPGVDPEIERYLDSLFPLLRGEPGPIRRFLAETEDHLREATRARIESGTAPDQAVRAAIAAFGQPRTVAASFKGTAAGNVLREAAFALAPVFIAGLLAIGASGGVAYIFGLVAGKAFVAGDAPGVTYTSERCDDFFRFDPGAADCMEAATAHHFDEVVGYRVDAGVLGVLSLLGWAAWRWRHRPGPQRILPAAFAPAVAVGSFGVAGFGLAGLGAMQSLSGAHGGGALLSAGLVALAAAAAWTLALLGSVGAGWRGRANDLAR